MGNHIVSYVSFIDVAGKTELPATYSLISQLNVVYNFLSVAHDILCT